jgi:hypothetical protein
LSVKLLWGAEQEISQTVPISVLNDAYRTELTVDGANQVLPVSVRRIRGNLIAVANRDCTYCCPGTSIRDDVRDSKDENDSGKQHCCHRQYDCALSSKNG